MYNNSHQKENGLFSREIIIVGMSCTTSVFQLIFFWQGNMQFFRGVAQSIVL